MFTLTYGQIRNEIFVAGLQALNAARDLAVGTAYNVAKICELVDKELSIVNNLYTKLLDPFMAKDGNGKWIPAAPGTAPPGSFKVVDGKAEELDAALAKFDAETIQVDRPRLKLDQALARHLAPREITALAPLFLPIDEAKLA